MADIDVISAAEASLEAALCKLTAFAQVCDTLNGDEDRPWVFLLTDLVTAVDGAAQAHIQAVNRHALPHLRDIAQARSKGGMGGMPPMVTKVVAGQSTPSRT
jgi:hypothetical protein